MIALVDRSSDLSGSILTPRKAAELELNSVSPSPDTVEEEKHITQRSIQANHLSGSRVRLKSTQNLTQPKLNT